ncbi:MAG: TetM/TetW/TetO/TetS family tetracycline resistance ribosomal protection protein [Lachnospiraceae bacterium]|nr:TetM/TetW/TetO/TetS family tetracycline resistance ribosomal protection protein [Lachnospiraceae bacterium]
MKTKHIVMGILAHVDAGKTTLSEQILYQCGATKKVGRVDHQDTFLDHHSLEKERGITIFSKQACFNLGEYGITLLDTPGHVDFSMEMERSLQVLDYAILVINGTDGVQSHTKTLWKLLERYHIPVFLFINKMDQPGNEKVSLLQQLKSKLSMDCVEFGQEGESFWEEIAVRDEVLMENFLEGNNPTKRNIQSLIMERKVYPCIFGSALKNIGVDSLLDIVKEYVMEKEYPDSFGARVFKIGRDGQNNRLTYMKITGGNLKVKQVVNGKSREHQEWSEKVDQLRIYSGTIFDRKDEVIAGQICSVTGLEHTYAGQALGEEKEDTISTMEAVLTYRVELSENVNVHQAYEKLQILAEEDPGLQISWIEKINEIHIKVMGDIQIEVLKQLILDRFQMEVGFGSGHIVYKETIDDVVEGVGHFEPLRHYAEVHLLLEPLPTGSGVQIDTVCSEDILDKNWQRLIATHLLEKQHVGVLAGAAVTDIKYTILTGKAHAKHTEGGDFRQATYRAVRQGLRKANSVLLEPVYEFTLEIPTSLVGRAMSDVQKMSGDIAISENQNTWDNDMTVLYGTCPVITMQEYQREVLAYTKGLGRLECRLKGYEPCHNTPEVLETLGYDPDRDLENPCGSVFCSHGAGITVDWTEVEEHMHLPLVYQKEESSNRQEALERKAVKREASRSIGTEEIDAILQRTYGANKKGGDYVAPQGWNRYKNKKQDAPVTRVYKGTPKKEAYLLVDGYNIIYAWKELKELAEVNLDGARGKLQDILCDYSAMKGCQVMVVFDAYRLKGHPVEVWDYHNIRVVFTKEAETADQYIEKFAHQHAKEYTITVATSDGLEQVIIRGQGCGLLSANDLQEEIKRSKELFQEQHMEKTLHDKVTLKEYMTEDLIKKITVSEE